MPIDPYHLGRDLGQAMHILQTHSSALEDHDKRLGKVENRQGLIIRIGIIAALWTGSLTGIFANDDITKAAIKMIRLGIAGF